MFKDLTRRQFLKTSAAAAAGSVAAPYLGCGNIKVAEPMTRTLGRTGFEVTTLGLGGQASLQWTAEDVDPAAIIVKAVNQGVNYLDTSNVYGPSQENFGEAFRALSLIPGRPDYDEVKRRSLYLASKTMVRHAKGSHPDVRDRSQGAAGSMAVDDLRRSLSQIFGDGEGDYPEGAYLDLFQIHNLNTMAEVEAIYVGLDDPDPAAERLGALAALRDYRDGTNRTGLNPKEEKLIRHIGITGHFSSPVMIECLQRDEASDLIDTMLIAINANDRRYLNHQYNAMPVAKAKNVGMIAMKVFADGAMYTKEPRWSRTPEDVVRLVGNPDLPSRPLIEYALSTPGVGTAIIGIGHIDKDDQNCQLVQNLSAAQIRPESFGEGDREQIENLGAKAREGQTNWFQVESQPLGAPREAAASVENRDGKPVVQLSWQTAYAAQEPIDHYEIQRDDQPAGRVEHSPQTTKAPFTFEETVEAGKHHTYQIITVDKAERTAATEPLKVTTA
jgi:aryl-alcohol dehydrogenase-like predicted oxidoreductase